MDLNSFINNLRNGIAEADRQANNFINMTGEGLGRAFNLGVVQPIQSLGSQIGQGIQQAIQPSVQQTQQPQQTQANTQLSSTANTQPVQTMQQAQPSVQLGNGQTYYYRDPAIDGFINTLRFLMNPIRGITGWTPLDMLADYTSDSMYSTFGKKVTDANKDNNEQIPDSTETNKKPEEAKLTSSTDDDVIVYTYKPGDTFGQVVKDLGLGTANGLWGANGDVDYYTKQLIDQGALNAYGNIPIGTTIKLRRRK